MAIRGGHVLPIPRTNNFEFAIQATNGTNQYSLKEIKLEPREIITEVPFPIHLLSPEMHAIRQSMKQLQQRILDSFEEEQKKIEEGVITITEGNLF